MKPMLSPVRTKFSSFRRWAVLRVVARERDVLPCRLVVAVAGRSGSRHAGERSRILDLGLRRSLFHRATPEGPLINFDDPTTGRVHLTAKLPNDSRLTPFIGGLSVSSDGEWLLYSQIDERSSDIMLVENFR